MSEFVPAFVKAQIYKGGPADAPETEQARDPVRVWHLLSHTSGLVYSWLGASAPYELTKRADEMLAERAGPAEWASCYAEAPCFSSPALHGTTLWRETCSAGSSSWPRASRSAHSAVTRSSAQCRCPTAAGTWSRRHERVVRRAPARGERGDNFTSTRWG